MTARSSDPSRRRGRSPSGDERGAVLAFVVLALIVILASAGLAIDLGRGYITKARLARAVDAAALAGARAFRIDEAEDEARAVFRANIPAPPPPASPVVPTVAPGTNERGEDTLAVSALQTVPTTFMKVVGINSMDVSASAVAAIPPIDLVLVLDVSISLANAGVFDELQEAAVVFLKHFHDDIDRLGLVAFQSSAVVARRVGHDFTAEMESLILNTFKSGGNTHAQDGLRRAREEITNPTPPRPNAAKVVVFFTDGKPTTVRDDFGCGTSVPDQTLVAWCVEDFNACFGGRYSGDAIYNYTVNTFPWGTGPGFNQNCGGQTRCCGFTANAVRDMARTAALVEAGRLRRGELAPGVPGPEPVLIYVIGLGDVQVEYLCRIANTKTTNVPGACNAVEPVAGEPQGKMYYVESADAGELRAVFQEVARDLIVRLAK